MIFISWRVICRRLQMASASLSNASNSSTVKRCCGFLWDGSWATLFSSYLGVLQGMALTMIGRQRTETASRLPCVQNIVGHRRADNKPRAFGYPYITLNMLLFARLFAF